MQFKIIVYYSKAILIQRVNFICNMKNDFRLKNSSKAINNQKFIAKPQCWLIKN